MAKWKITVNHEKQKGQLDKVNEFLQGPETLAGFEAITPITQDQKIAMMHAPDPIIVQNIHSTRGQTMPRSYHEKTGFLFGRYI